MYILPLCFLVGLQHMAFKGLNIGVYSAEFTLN